MYPKFEIKKQTKNGRLGLIKTAHGNIETPAFIFCATKGALKAEWPQMAREAETQIILSNTYHLLVYPGSELINELGGLQKMLSWHGPMMTDSGGYQIFSLGYGSVSQELKGIRDTKKTLVKISEAGAHFKSYRDGREIFLSPEFSMKAQIDFGADLVFVLDECTPFHITKLETERSMNRSHRWAKRSLDYFEMHKKAHQGLYGIIQGGIYPDLREKSIEEINDLPFFGTGIGGSLGKNIQDMEDVLKFLAPKFAVERPRHLLGIGTISAILMAIPYGIDTFDCVYPTRLARHGGALVPKILATNKENYINLKNNVYSKDNRPIDVECDCCTCASFSRAYLHLLLKVDETLAIMALTHHNIRFMNVLMASARRALLEDCWEEFLTSWSQ